MLKQLIKKGTIDPRRLFLIDGIGAIVSAVLLGIVLVKFHLFFGIPVQSLYFLAALPCFFAVFDFYCYFKKVKRIGVFLKVIALINISYCVLSIGLAVYHNEEVTYLGWAYILVEIFIVATLAMIELKVANSLNK